jgi:hypothetical protein
MDDRPRKARPKRRELSRRVSAGLEVILYWGGRRSSVTLSVHDASTGEAFEVEVPATAALDAFQHPYAYSGGRRMAAVTDA